MSRLFTKEEEEFILSNYKGIYNYELAEKVNVRFGTNYTAQQVKNYKNRHMLDSGLSGPVRPVGSKNIKNEVIKTKDGQWKNIRRAKWEEHYGKIPEGHVIIPLDGDKSNCEIDNLQLIPKGIASTMFRGGLIYSDPELTKAGILIAKCIAVTNKRKKEIKNRNNCDK